MGHGLFWYGDAMNIDIFADIACPWCWIGIRRLDRALALRPHISVPRRWRPYQLQPGLPPEGIAFASFIEAKFGGRERARAMFQRVAQEGESEGITFNFDNIAKANLTEDAHRLVLLADAQGRAWEMAERLFQGYFQEGRDLNASSDLTELAVAAGMDAAEAERLVQGRQYAEEVARSQQQASAEGVTGVPFYVFNGRFGLSGAQPLDTLLHLIDRFAPGGDLA